MQVLQFDKSKPSKQSLCKISSRNRLTLQRANEIVANHACNMAKVDKNQSICSDNYKNEVQSNSIKFGTTHTIQKHNA